MADGGFYLRVAEKLLEGHDFAGSKMFAELAIEADPLLDGADWIIAAADVLQSSSRRRINHHMDWYEVLQIGASAGDRQISAVRRQYRRLSLLLRAPGRPISAAADEALRLVESAWKVLSDPVKKNLYDKELLISASPEKSSSAAAAAERTPDGGAFWTVCGGCFHIHQYARGCEGRTLICQSCGKPFMARELQSPPSIVPGTDTYYCVWGLVPLGFPRESAHWSSAPISPFFPDPTDQMRFDLRPSPVPVESKAEPPKMRRKKAVVVRPRKRLAEEPVPDGKT
ncbi:pentatricopeptide repeat (PPR) superfamily protein isoform X2 [Wolffia australiana]